MVDYRKLSPALAGALDDFRDLGRAGLAAHAGDMGLVSIAPAVKPPRVIAFLHCDEEASLAHLAGLGVEVNGGDGPVRTAIVALEAVGPLSEDPAIRLVVPSRPVELFLDVATQKVGLPALRRRARLAGRGVVVGVVDTGIESTHPSFAGRILRTWDQTVVGRGVAEGGYGQELSGPALALSRDTIGHGTHVAGIAAGADERFTGVAPEAELVVVKTDLQTAHIADGVRYVFRVAGELGRAAVVNLSLGGHDDPHDGTDSLSAVVDAASGSGRIVVCAAGNSGNHNIHAQLDLLAGHARSVACALPSPPPGQAAAAAFTGWYSGRDTMAVAVVAPGGAQTPFQPPITDGSPVRTYELAGATVRITTPGPDPANGDHGFLVQVRQTGSGPGGALSTWRLRLKGLSIAEGEVHVWSISARAAQFTGRAVRDSHKVGSPAAATRAVSVASYTTRNEWEDLLGNQQVAGLDEDDISDFSSEGPRRGGGPKPDLAAPGAMIVSSLSVHSPVEPSELIDDRHLVMAGTSMAAPFVSGLVALLLERDPKLEPETAKELLQAASAVPGRPAGAFDPKWGRGLVDAARLAQDP